MRHLQQLATGTILSQLFLLLATVVSLVSYSPEDIGIYGSGLAVVYACAHFSGLRLDGLMVADFQQKELFFLFSRWIQKFQTVAVFILCWLYFHDALTAALLAFIFYYYSLALLNATYALQEKEFKGVSKWKAIGSFNLLIGQAVCSFTSYGLLVGDAMGKYTHATFTKVKLKSLLFDWPILLIQLLLYRKSLVLLNLSTCGSVLSMYGPLLVISWQLGPAEGAIFYLVQRLAGFTEQLIGYTYYQFTVSHSDGQVNYVNKLYLKQTGTRMTLFSFLLLSFTFGGLLFIKFIPSLAEWGEIIPLFLYYAPLCWLQTILFPLRSYLTMSKNWLALFYGELGRGLATVSLTLLATTIFVDHYGVWVCLGGSLFAALTVWYYCHSLIRNGHSEQLSSS